MHLLKSDSAKQRILKSAIDLTEDRSAQFVQLRDIAKAAGVSPSLILFHFASREDLLLEVRFMRWEQFGIREFNEWRRQHPNADLPQLLTALFYRDLERGHRSRDLMSMGYWWSIEDEKRYKGLIQVRLDATREILARTYAKAGDRALDQAVRVLTYTYTAILREAHVTAMSVDAAVQSALFALTPTLDWLERGQ